WAESSCNRKRPIGRGSPKRSRKLCVRLEGRRLMSANRWTKRLVRIFWRSQQASNEIDEEINFHIAMRADELERGGLSSAEAERAARSVFGNITKIGDSCREIRGVGIVEGFRQDLNFGLRLMKRNPAFTAIALITLALSIGFNSAIFSIVAAVLIKPLPFA